MHKLNQAYLVTQITHEGEQPQSLDQDAPESSSRYHNRFEVIPEGIEWRAHHYFHGDAPRKPRVDGPQLARVVGPKGEEIFCDDYGRVKLQFPWDRHGKGDESSSCWVRVSQLWAGTKYGGMAIPRIGQEVIVEFLDGDIDQPIITGRTYNAHNLPPYELPVNKTVTTWKSDTHKGRGSNELRFEDEDGKEEVYLHAETDTRFHTRRNKTEIVGNNFSSVIVGKRILQSMERSEFKSNTAILIKAAGGSNVKTPNSGVKQALRAKHSPDVDSGLYKGVTIISGDILKLKSKKNTEISTDKSIVQAAKQIYNLHSGKGNTISSSGYSHIEAQGEIRIVSQGRQIISSDRELLIKSGSGSISIDSSGAVNIKATSLNLLSDGDVNIKSGGNVKINGSKIKLN